MSSEDQNNSIRFGDAVTSFLRESNPAIDENLFRTKSHLLNRDI